MNQPVDSALAAARLFELQRMQSRTSAPASWDVRADRLRRLRKMVADNRVALATAIGADFGQRSRHETELLEIGSLLDAIGHSLKHGRGWMREQRRSPGYKFWPGKASVVPQPLGVVGIVVPWNYPLLLALGPANSALVAGNRVLIKLSEFTPRFAELLATLVAQYFQPEELAIVNGDAAVARQFCALPFDHLLFTGSTGVGRHVMHAAADNLTPVTLELGGKSPAIVGPGADLEAAATRIVAGKTFNAGQTCVAPDYALVPRADVARFIDAARRVVQRHYPALAKTLDYTSIITDHHFARLQGLVDDAVARGATAWPLSDASNDAQRRLFAPVALTGVPAECSVLADEIFGPVLPIVAYDNLDEALAWVNARPRPLALYIFERDAALVERVLAHTVSGGVTVNDTLVHFGPDTLPVGGVGASGMGAYHGEDGFRTFSHYKPVFRRGPFSLMPLMYPPFGRLIELLLRMPRPPKPWGEKV